MESTEAKSLVLLFPTSGAQNKYLLQAKEWLQDDQTLQVHEATSVADVGKQIAQYNQGLLIFSVRDKNDLVEVVNCLATHQNLVKGRFLRVVGVCYMEHPEVIKLLMKRGVADILPTNLTSKALKHKISQSFKILERYHAGHAQDLARDAANAASQEKKNVVSIRNKPSVQRTPPLTLMSDCWLVRKDKDLRQIQGRWLVDLLGPGPSIASWDETPRSNMNAPEWVWTLRQPNTQFVSEEGSWIFKGRKPEFVWTENRWRFVGEQAELVFVRNGEILAYRIKCNHAQNVLEVAENSEQAKKKLPFMIQSIEAEVRFKNEKNKPNLAKQFALGDGADEEQEDEQQEDPEDIPRVEEEVAPSLGLQMWISADPHGRNPMQLAPIEMSPVELVVEVPSGQFSKTQKVCLIIDTGLKKHNSKTQFQAVVAGHEASDADHDLLTIRLSDGKRLPIESAEEEIRARQDEIFNFLKAARGW